MKKVFATLLVLSLILFGCSKDTTKEEAKAKRAVSGEGAAGLESTESIDKNDETTSGANLPTDGKYNLYEQASEITQYGGEPFTNLETRTIFRGSYPVGDLLYVYFESMENEHIEDSYVSIGKDNKWVVKDLKLEEFGNGVYAYANYFNGSNGRFIIEPDGKLKEFTYPKKHRTSQGIHTSKGYALLIENEDNSLSIFYPQSKEEIPVKVIEGSGIKSYMLLVSNAMFADLETKKLFFVKSNMHSGINVLNYETGELEYDQAGKEIEIGSDIQSLFINSNTLYAIATSDGKKDLVVYDNQYIELNRIPYNTQYGLENYDTFQGEPPVIAPKGHLITFYQIANFKNRPSILVFDITS